MPGPGGDGVAIDISGTNIFLDDELAAALKPDLRQTWKVFAPAGRIDFDGTVQAVPADQPPENPDIELTVIPRGCSIRPRVLPVRPRAICRARCITPRTGCIWKRSGRGTARRCSGLEDGNVFCKKGSGIWAELVDVWGSPIYLDEAFVRPCRTACARPAPRFSSRARSR